MRFVYPLPPPDFEDYLMEVFMDEEPQILDDDLPDAFDAWISNLQADDFIAHANEWVQSLNGSHPTANE